MSQAVIEFLMDADYYKEFHSEWISAVGRGWRVDRAMVPLFMAGGICLAVVGLQRSVLALTVPGLLCCLFAAVEFAKGKRKKAQWLAHALALPWSGKTMRIKVENRALVQNHEFEGDPRFERSGDLLDTPNGYLLRYQSAGIPVPITAISDTFASVYIPHRAIQPAMTRAQFRSLLD